MQNTRASETSGEIASYPEKNRESLDSDCVFLGFAVSDSGRLNAGEFLPYVGDKIEPFLRNPVIIPRSTFDYLAADMLRNLPQYRFVFLTMKDYQLAMRQDEEHQTHLIMFCMRPISDNRYQPLGVFTADINLALAEQMAIIWRAFIEDLSILGITVLASLSSTSPIFHGALKILTENDHALTQYAPIIYSIPPFRKIIHLFDFESLANLFENTLRSCDQIYFLAAVFKVPPGGDEDDPRGEVNYYETSYQDIKRYQSQFDETNMSLFDDRLERLIQEEHARKSKRLFRSESIKRLLDNIHCITKIKKIDAQWRPEWLEKLYECFENFRVVLATAHFAIDGNVAPCVLEALPDISSLCNRKRAGSKGERFVFHTMQPKNIFDCFLYAVTYDDREYYMKVLAHTYDEFSIDTCHSFQDDSESDGNISDSINNDTDSSATVENNEYPQITVDDKGEKIFEEIQTSDAAIEPVMETTGSNILIESIMKFSSEDFSENITFQAVKKFIIDQIKSGNITDPLYGSLKDITSLREAVNLLKQRLNNMTRILLYYNKELSVSCKTIELAEAKNSALSRMPELMDKKNAPITSHGKQNTKIDQESSATYSACTDAAGTDAIKKSIEDLTSDQSSEEFARLEDFVSGHITAEATLSCLDTLKQKSKTCKEVIEFFLAIIKKLTDISTNDTPEKTKSLVVKRILMDNETTYDSSSIWDAIVNLLEEVEVDDKLDNRPNQIEESEHIENPENRPPKYSENKQYVKNIVTMSEDNYENRDDEVKNFNIEDDSSSMPFISDELRTIADAIINEMEESYSIVSDVSNTGSDAYRSSSEAVSSPELSFEDEEYEMWEYPYNLIQQHDVYVLRNNRWRKCENPTKYNANDDSHLNCTAEAKTLKYPESETFDKQIQADADTSADSKMITQPKEFISSTDDKMPKSKAKGNLISMEQVSKPDSAQVESVSDSLILIEQSDKLKKLKNLISQQIANDVRLKSLKFDQNTVNQLMEVLSKVTSFIDSNDQELIPYTAAGSGLSDVKTSDHIVNVGHSINTKKNAFQPNQLDMKIQLEDINKANKNRKSISTSVTESSKPLIKISSELIKVGNIITETVKVKEDSNLTCKEAHNTLEKLDHFLSKLFTEDGNVKTMESFNKRTVICKVVISCLNPFCPGPYVENAYKQEDSGSGNNIQNVPNEHLALLPTDQNTKGEKPIKKRGGKIDANFNSAFESKPKPRVTAGNKKRNPDTDSDDNKSQALNSTVFEDAENPNAHKLTGENSTISKNDLLNVINEATTNSSKDPSVIEIKGLVYRRQELSEEMRELDIAGVYLLHKSDSELIEGQTPFQVGDNSVNNQSKEPEITTEYSDTEDAHKTSNAKAEESALTDSDTKDLAALAQEPDGNVSKELKDEKDTLKQIGEYKADNFSSDSSTHSANNIDLEKTTINAFVDFERPWTIASVEDDDKHQTLSEQLRNLPIISASPFRNVVSSTLAAPKEDHTPFQVNDNSINNLKKNEKTTEYSGTDDDHKNSIATAEKSALAYSDTENFVAFPKEPDGNTSKELHDEDETPKPPKENKENHNADNFTSENAANSENNIFIVAKPKEADTNASEGFENTSSIESAEYLDGHQKLIEQLHNLPLGSILPLPEIDSASLLELIESETLFQVNENAVNNQSKGPEVTTEYSDTNDADKNSNGTVEKMLTHSDIEDIADLLKKSDGNISDGFNNDKETSKQPEEDKENISAVEFTSKSPTNSEHFISSVTTFKEATANASGVFEDSASVARAKEADRHQTLSEQLHNLPIISTSAMLEVDSATLSERIGGQSPFQVDDNSVNNQSEGLEVSTEYRETIDAHKNSKATTETKDIAAVLKDSDGNMSKELNNEKETLKQPEDDKEDPNTDKFTSKGTVNAENYIFSVANFKEATTNASGVGTLSKLLHNVPHGSISPLPEMDSATLSVVVESETPFQGNENAVNNKSEDPKVTSDTGDAHRNSTAVDESALAHSDTKDIAALPKKADENVNKALNDEEKTLKLLLEDKEKPNADKFTPEDLANPENVISSVTNFKEATTKAPEVLESSPSVENANGHQTFIEKLHNLKNSISMVVKAEDISHAVIASQQRRAKLRDLINNIYGGVRGPNVSTEPHHKEEDVFRQKSSNLNIADVSLKATAVIEPFVDNKKTNELEMWNVHPNDLIQHHAHDNSENTQLRQLQEAVGHNVNVDILISSNFTPKDQTVKDPDNEKLTLDNEHSNANVRKSLELSSDQNEKNQSINAENDSQIDDTIINANVLIESECNQERAKTGEKSEDLKTMKQDAGTQSTITEKEASLNELMVKKQEEKLENGDITFRNYESIMHRVKTFTANIESGNSSITRLKKLLNKVTSVLDSSNQQLYTLSKASGSELPEDENSESTERFEPFKNNKSLSVSCIQPQADNKSEVEPSNQPEELIYSDCKNFNTDDQEEDAKLPSAKDEGADDLTKLDAFISKLFIDQVTSNSAEDLRHRTKLCKVIIDPLMAILQKMSDSENIIKPEANHSEPLPDVSIGEMSVSPENKTFAPSEPLIENERANVASGQNQLDDNEGNSRYQELSDTTECNRKIDALGTGDLKDKAEQLKQMLPEDTNCNTSKQPFQSLADPKNFSLIPTVGEVKPNATKMRELKETITNAIGAIQDASRRASAQRKPDGMGLSNVAITECNMQLKTAKHFRFISGVLIEEKRTEEDESIKITEEVDKNPGQNVKKASDVHMTEDNVNQTGRDEKESNAEGMNSLRPVQAVKDDYVVVTTKDAEGSQQIEEESKQIDSHLTGVLKESQQVPNEHQTESFQELNILRLLTLEELRVLERNAQKGKHLVRSVSDAANEIKAVSNRKRKKIGSKCMLSNINDSQPLEERLSTSEKKVNEHQRRIRKRRSTFREKCTWYVNNLVSSELPTLESLRAANIDDDDSDESMSDSTESDPDKMAIFAMRTAPAMSEPFNPVYLQKNDMYKDRINFVMVYNRIPKNSYGQLISSLWLSTLKGYMVLMGMLNSHFVKWVPSRLLFTEHIDHFVFTHLKQQIHQNEKPSIRGSYVCSSLPAAQKLLKQVHKIKQNVKRKADSHKDMKNHDTNWYSSSESPNRKL